MAKFIPENGLILLSFKIVSASVYLILENVKQGVVIATVVFLMKQDPLVHNSIMQAL